VKIAISLTVKNLNNDIKVVDFLEVEAKEPLEEFEKRGNRLFIWRGSGFVKRKRVIVTRIW